ncbi:MAG TPA: sugar ABC transporter ATP-binding protein [Candidatus Sulfomarinibacteraceae bacterium]|nr:sugar ABC transporter ATP-binding protein [Candidatus Sulfomarinibacteraceae bacterium]
MSETPHVEARGIHKHFGGVHALDDIHLVIERGGVHGLVGENGAGKSTLGKIISGVLRPDSDDGELLVNGRTVHYSTPYQALADGIAMISQEVALVPQLSVMENVFLGIESRRGGLFVDRQNTRRRFEALIAHSGFELPADTLVSGLSFADMKKVEILKAIARNAELIVMDEPTAALPSDESERLLQIIRQLREKGTTIIFVSHFLEEVLAVADVITVLRNGSLIRTAPVAEETPQSLVRAMLGRDVSLTFPPKQYPPADAPIVLSVDNLSQKGRVEAISFHLRAGEIVGLAGLVGAGRSIVARMLFGAEPRDSGAITMDGRPLTINSPYDAVQEGVAMLPESRKEQGLLMNLRVGENVTLPHLQEISQRILVRRQREHEQTADLLSRLDVRPPQPAVRVTSLSGGNQQKVLFAKWLFRRPRLLICDEPTHGVDVGAKLAIYELITELAAAGIAILLISSELEELLGLAHRVLVMRQGRIVADFDEDPAAGRFLSEDAIMQAAFATEENGNK